MHSEVTFECDLAWKFFDSIREHLTNAEWHRISIALGAGSYLFAIESLLAVAATECAQLPSELGDRLTSWARSYVGHPDHRRITKILTAALSKRPPAIATRHHDGAPSHTADVPKSPETIGSAKGARPDARISNNFEIATAP